tara:strand:+ start:1157 stop:1909 length:753 start_codon:yes stop_codon:yes gene_type:complete
LSDQARTLPPGSVKDRQVSGQAKIGHGKLAQVADAQVLVGGSNKKLSAKTVSGDATLANDGTLTLDDAKLETRVKAVLTDLDIESGSQKNIKADEIKKIYEELPGVGRFTSSFENDLRLAGDENTSSTLMKRDDDGSVKVKVDKFVAGSATTTTVGTQTTTTQSHPNKKITEVVSGTDGSGPNSATQFTVAHGFGHIPQAELYRVDGDDEYPIEAEVLSTTTSTTVKFTQSIGSMPASNVTRPNIKLVLG